MPRRSGLGRGLGALIPAEVSGSASALRELPLSQVRPNQFQPRSQFSEEALASLVDSIRSVGVLQPVLVREVGEGEYELIAGERRCRAARRAGLQTIPALVQSATDLASLAQALVENIQREDLNALDEAAGYQQLIEDFSLTHEEVARRVGRSRAAVSNALRLFQLPPAVQRLVREERLSAGHARALLATPDREAQERLGAEAVAEGLSVRALEDRVRGLAAADISELGWDEPGGSGEEDHLPGEVPAGHDDGGTAGGPADPATVSGEPAPRPIGAGEALDRGRMPAGGNGALPPNAGPQLRPPGVLELEQLLADHLDTRVHVEMGGKHGRVVIEFATLEDLERIYRVMIAGRPG